MLQEKIILPAVGADVPAKALYALSHAIERLPGANALLVDADWRTAADVVASHVQAGNLPDSLHVHGGGSVEDCVAAMRGHGIALGDAWLFWEHNASRWFSPRYRAGPGFWICSISAIAANPLTISRSCSSRSTRKNRRSLLLGREPALHSCRANVMHARTSLPSAITRISLVSPTTTSVRSGPTLTLADATAFWIWTGGPGWELAGASSSSKVAAGGIWRRSPTPLARYAGKA